MVHTSILGNISERAWAERASKATVENIHLDQWSAQKSRLAIEGDRGTRYAIALGRGRHLEDGDVVSYDPVGNVMAVVRLRLSDIMVIDMGALARMAPEVIIHTAVELGHAVGNQHWPAVVRGVKVYVPLAVDRRVMQSVMKSHRFDHIAYSFQPSDQITPYLSPHEVRRLMGGQTHHSHSDKSHHHDE